MTVEVAILLTCLVMWLQSHLGEPERLKHSQRLKQIQKRYEQVASGLERNADFHDNDEYPNRFYTTSKYVCDR